MTHFVGVYRHGPRRFRACLRWRGRMVALSNFLFDYEKAIYRETATRSAELCAHMRDRVIRRLPELARNRLNFAESAGPTLAECEELEELNQVAAIIRERLRKQRARETWGPSGKPNAEQKQKLGRRKTH